MSSTTSTDDKVESTVPLYPQERAFVVRFDRTFRLRQVCRQARDWRAAAVRNICCIYYLVCSVFSRGYSWSGIFRKILNY